jgi:hypothetical protein
MDYKPLELDTGKLHTGKLHTGTRILLTYLHVKGEVLLMYNGYC